MAFWKRMQERSPLFHRTCNASIHCCAAALASSFVGVSATRASAPKTAMQALAAATACMPMARLAAPRQQQRQQRHAPAAASRRQQPCRRSAARRLVMVTAEAGTSGAAAASQLQAFSQTAPQRVLGADGKLAEVRRGRLACSAAETFCPAKA